MAHKPTRKRTKDGTARKGQSGDGFASVSLAGPALRESDKLDLRDRHDGVDSSQLLVRGGRFRSSYMMATNGGATYEEMLRPHSRSEVSSVPNSAPTVPDQTPTLQNVLGGSDERTPIADTSSIPARSVGLLKILPEDGVLRYGTAWLIGPQTLATAAHNLIHPVAGKTRKLDVGMAYDGNAARGGWHSVIDCRFSVGWQDEPREGSPYDYAVLKIENPEIGNRLGWFGYADYEDEKFGNMIVNIFGYPLDLKRFNMYGVAGRVMDIEGGRIFYDCDTGGGMSGGPVIARFGEQRVAVGVHVAGGTASNVATRIDDAAFELLEKYKSWS